VKLIASVAGTTAIHVSADDVRPPRGALTRDIIDFVGNTYNFSVRPEIPQRLAPGLPPWIIFQSGEFLTEDGKVPVVSMAAFAAGGFLAICIDTDTSDKFLEHLSQQLDNHFEYRIGQSAKRYEHQSNIVVELDPEFERHLAWSNRIETLLNNRISRPDYPFRLKRIGFGYGDPPNSTDPNPKLDIGRTDFHIERRAGEPYDRNRYFSAAPTRNQEHVRLLEDIEALSLRNG
jgi:hypothetical protein